MKSIAPVRLLKLALYADAAGSLTLGVLQLWHAEKLPAMLSLPALLLMETGYFMLAYALLLAYLANARRVWVAAVQCIVVGNVGWAIACLALMGTGLVSPSAAGVSYLALHAVAVLMFAYFERAGLRASLGNDPSPSLRYN